MSDVTARLAKHTAAYWEKLYFIQRIAKEKCDTDMQHAFERITELVGQVDTKNEELKEEVAKAGTLRIMLASGNARFEELNNMVKEVWQLLTAHPWQTHIEAAPIGKLLVQAKERGIWKP